jgi:negative regulator of sigma E activity
MRTDNNANGTKADEYYLQELSALLDGESNDTEDVLRRAVVSDDCRDSWQSYHLIRDVLQKEHHSALPADFASRVSASIAMEDNIADSTADVIPLARARETREQRRVVRPRESQVAAPRWLPFAGLGLAASVAAAGFIGWQVFSNSQSQGPAADITVAQAVIESPQVVPQASDSGLVRTVYRGESGTNWVPVGGARDAKVEQRLNSLLMNHLEDASLSSVQGLVAQTRVVGYDSESINESF